MGGSSAELQIPPSAQQHAVAAGCHMPCTADQPLDLRANARIPRPPLRLCDGGFEQTLRDRPLIGSAGQRIMGAQHQNPPPRPRFAAVERSREGTGPAKRQKAAQCKERPLGRMEPGRTVAQADGSATKRAARAVETNGVQSIGQQQVLHIANREQASHSAETRKVEPVAWLRNPAAFDAQNIRVNFRTPDRPRDGYTQARILELYQAARSRRRAGKVGCRKRQPGGLAILRIAAEPFPGEQRAVRLEQAGISGPIAPVQPGYALRLHRGKRAGSVPGAHSPIKTGFSRPGAAVPAHNEISCISRNRKLLTESLVRNQSTNFRWNPGRISENF